MNRGEQQQPKAQTKKDDGVKKFRRELISTYFEMPAQGLSSAGMGFEVG